MPIPLSAFVLGAGRGTRLQPLTDELPKPLLPLAHRPLITHAFDHILESTPVEEIIVNTHHAAAAYQKYFTNGCYRSVPLHFRHEPELLDTGGGVANILDRLPDDSPLLVYNGDIFCRTPLQPLIKAHHDSGAAATLLLRHSGPLANVTLADGDTSVTRITDFRDVLGTEGPRGQYTGIAILGPDFRRFLPKPGSPASLIDCLLDALRADVPVYALLSDEGPWHDLGNRSSLLAAHAQWPDPQPPRIHPDAAIAPGSRIDATTWVGSGAVVGDGASLEGCLLFSNARVAADSNLRHCIVASGHRAGGDAENRDF